MAAPGYYPSPWPGEDGGPQRQQIPTGIKGLNIQPGDELTTVSRRLLVGNMVLLRAPGEVYLMHHDGLRKNFGFHSHSYIEKIDPETLKTIKKSPQLAGGPFWPGGFTIHRNGDLYVTFGRYMHRLNPNCELLSSYMLPQNLPYNSHLILDNGYLVTKPISSGPATQIVIMDPDTLTPACVVDMPEPSISRLSSSGNTVYVTGVTTICRYHFDGDARTLELDKHWSLDYVGSSPQTYAWDPVIDDNNIWFMDNGEHKASTSMLHEGVSPTPNNIIRVNVHDCRDFSITPICSESHGSITNPPIYCTQRQILVAYDSSNSVVQAWRHDIESNELVPLWKRKGFGMVGHTIYYPDTGEMVTEDYRSLKTWRGLRNGEENVILDIETGREKARFPMGNYLQSFCFSAPGFGRDYYWLGMDKLTHVTVKTP